MATASNYSLTPEWNIRRLISSLERQKAGALSEWLFASDGKGAAALKASDAAIDLCIDYWKKLLDSGDQTKMAAAFAGWLAEERRSDEDEIIARADEIKARREAEKSAALSPTDGAPSDPPKVRTQ